MPRALTPIISTFSGQWEDTVKIDTGSNLLFWLLRALSQITVLNAMDEEAAIGIKALGK